MTEIKEDDVEIDVEDERTTSVEKLIVEKKTTFLTEQGDTRLLLFTTTTRQSVSQSEGKYRISILPGFYNEYNNNKNMHIPFYRILPTITTIVIHHSSGLSLPQHTTLPLDRDFMSPITHHSNLTPSLAGH